MVNRRVLPLTGRLIFLLMLVSLLSCRDEIPVAPPAVENATQINQASLSVEQAVDLWVFDDTLRPPWINSSWSTTVVFGSTEQQYAGTKSIKATTAAWGGLSLRNGPWGSPPFSTSGYQTFDFAVYPAAIGLKLSVFFEGAAGQTFPKVPTGTLPANQWTVISIPVGQLNPGNQTVDRIAIQDLSGTSKTWYVDQERLSGGGGQVAPPAPTLSSPANGSTGVATNPTLSWNASAGAASYRLQVSTTTAFTTTVYDLGNLTTTSAPTSGLSNNTTYYWRVNATNGGGTGDWSTVSGFTTVAVTPPPASGLWIYQDALNPPWVNTSWSTTVVFGSTERFYAGTNSIKATTSAWGALSLHYGPWGSPGAATTGYESVVFAIYPLSTGTILSVFFENDGGQTFPHINGSTLPANQWTLISIPMNQLNPGNLPVNRLSIMERSGSTKTFYVDDERFAGTAPPGTPPAVPTLVSPGNGATGQPTNPTFNWNSSTGATSYRFQLSTQSSFASTVVDRSGLTSPSTSASGLSNNTSYYWRVNATGSGGTSDWSSTWTLTTVAAGAPAPDLTIDAARMQSSVQIITRTISSTSCAVVETCASAGSRRLLRFDVVVQNFGTADLFFGDPGDHPELFIFSACHGHYHFKQFAEYRLLNGAGNRVLIGRKQAFCMMDGIRYWPGSPSRGYNCDYQGISVGWADIYDRSLDCQWLDVTGIPAGTYTIEVEVNYGGVINEGVNAYPNIARATVTIP